MFDFLKEEMGMEFTAGVKTNPREERSNEGVDVLAKSVLMNLLGLTQETTDMVLGMISSAGEDAGMVQHLKTLPISVHGRLNQILDMVELTDPAEDPDLDPETGDDMIDQTGEYDDNFDVDTDDTEYPDGYDGVINDPDDPDNVQYDDAFSDNPVWDPEQDREDTFRQDAIPTANPGDYQPTQQRESVVRKSLLSFMNEDARVDATVASVGDDVDDDIDPRDQAKIEQLEKAGNKAGADQLRIRSLQKKNARGPKTQVTPQQKRVDQAKSQLARAVELQRKTEG